MLYTPITKIAMRICFDAHKDQVDKTGLPYVFHPFHLAEQMETEAETCVALLHDVMEDTDTTAEQLIAAGIPQPYVETLRLLTHEDGVPYFDYVAALAHDPVARKVKMADLRHNSDLTRLDVVGEPDIRRVEKYRKAMALLEGFGGE
ncbi:MAG: GTP pyrophosphokinase [Eggerthellaceae bacterium]|nr:GTP pyrophosphokinase [Eggerthellaceae bacterium]